MLPLPLPPPLSRSHSHSVRIDVWVLSTFSLSPNIHMHLVYSKEHTREIFISYTVCVSVSIPLLLLLCKYFCPISSRPHQLCVIFLTRIWRMGDEKEPQLKQGLSTLEPPHPTPPPIPSHQPEQLV